MSERLTLRLSLNLYAFYHQSPVIPYSRYLRVPAEGEIPESFVSTCRTPHGERRCSCGMYDLEWVQLETVKSVVDGTIAIAGIIDMLNGVAASEEAAGGVKPEPPATSPEAPP